MSTRSWKTQNTSANVRLTLFLLPLALLCCFVMLKIYQPEFYLWLILEDHLLEWAQCVIYCSTALISASITISLFKSEDYARGLLWLIFSLSMLFVGGEEISWGHSMLGLSVPEYIKNHNVQGDLTLHNLDVVQPYLHNAYIAVGLLAALAWIALAPLGNSQYANWLKLFIPPWYLSSYFLPTAIVYGLIEHISPWLLTAFGWEFIRFSFNANETFLLFKDQETVELLFAMGFLIFAAEKSLSISRSDTKFASRPRPSPLPPHQE